MTRPSFATYLSSASARLCAAGAVSLAAMALTFAFCLAPQAGAQTHRSGTPAYTATAGAHNVRAHTHGAGARARKAACSATHTKHGSRTCSPSRVHKHKAKIEGHHRRATGSSHAPAQGKAQTPPAAAPGGSSGMTCSNGANATLDEAGTFACAGGGEPGCQEGFSPIVADNGATLVCEPEQVEAGGEEEG